MRLDALWLTDFRSYAAAELHPDPDGLTVVVGANGEGKTNLLEAVGYLATLASFRGAPGEALVRQGCERAVVRAEGVRDGRPVLLEAEVRRVGRDRVQVNRQALQRTRDLLGALRVSVFSPDDLALVKGGPAERRRYLDDALVALHPRWDALQGDVERVLRQRNALLKQAGGRATAEVVATLDVWDAALADAGGRLVDARAGLTGALGPLLGDAYDRLAGRPSVVHAEYVRSWSGGLADALVGARADDLRRGVTTIGPHRDELVLSVGSLPARTHASQGEQRSLALSLRLAAHHLVAERVGSPPVLLLDDVFSELDPTRAASLVASLPAGQALLTTAGDLPAAIRPDRVVRVAAGTLLGAA